MITQEQLDAYLAELTEKHIENGNEYFTEKNKPEFTVKTGKKYHKVFCKDKAHKAIHCFIDFDGNLYKAANSKSPAKGIRGNILIDKKPIFLRDFYR